MAIEPEYPILTDRLALRPFGPDDAMAIHDYRCREDVARYLFEGPLDLADCAAIVLQRAGQTSILADGDKIILAVTTRRSDTPVGEISLLCHSMSARQVEIGWILSPGVQKRGYATEAAAAMLRLAFENDMHRAAARCDVRNLDSVRLMERLGMRREAHLREHGIVKGAWNEEFIYAILRREWLLRHPSRER